MACMPPLPPLPSSSPKAFFPFDRFSRCNFCICRDLKPENMLLVQPGVESELKLIDFGLATTIKPGEVLRRHVGTPYYIAPEVSGSERRCSQAITSGVSSCNVCTRKCAFFVRWQECPPASVLCIRRSPRFCFFGFPAAMHSIHLSTDECAYFKLATQPLCNPSMYCLARACVCVCAGAG